MMKYRCFLIKLTMVLCSLINYVASDAPNFVSGFGLTVISSTQLSSQLYEVVVSSENIRDNQTIRILIPADYSTSGPSRRYPVLYLLHGAGGGSKDWTTFGSAQNTTRNVSLITVMPNGDPYGFYTNWVLPGEVAPQRWRSYHMEQLVPWIDLNLRTVAEREGRAIAGLSMGGYGAIHYAEFYPEYFISASSFSGVLDLMDARIQDVVFIMPGPTKPLIGPFGYPSTDPAGSNAWYAENTIIRAEKLRNMSLALYTGNVGFTEHYLRFGAYNLWSTLVSSKIPVHFDDYGSGKSIGPGCNGSHSWPCWNEAFIDVLPRIMAVLKQQY